MGTFEPPEDPDHKVIGLLFWDFSKGKILSVTRILLAVFICYLSFPFMIGGGWLLVNVGIIGTKMESDPTFLEQLKKSKGTPQNREIVLSLVKISQAKAVIILSFLVFLICGFIYGLIARDWKFSFLVFLFTLFRINPILLKIDLSFITKVAIITLQLLFLYGSAYFFSNLRFRPKKGKIG